MARRFAATVRNQGMGALALFLVVAGGTAYATHEQILSSDIVNGEVRTADLGTNAVTSAKVANNSLTLVDINKPPWQVVADNPQTASNPCPAQTAVFCGEADGDYIWTNYGEVWQTARFFRDSVGVVHVQGLVQLERSADLGPSPPLDVVIFILPPGYRPANALTFPVVCQANDSDASTTVVEHGQVDIGNNGHVRWNWESNPPGAPESIDNCDPFSDRPGVIEGNGNGYISLSGISFREEQ